MSGRRIFLILTAVLTMQGGQAVVEPLLREPPQFLDGQTRLVVTFNTIVDPTSSISDSCKLYNDTVKGTLLGEMKDTTSNPLRIIVEGDPCEVITDLFITCPILGHAGKTIEVSSLHFDYDDLPPRCSNSTSSADNIGYIVGGVLGVIGIAVLAGMGIRWFCARDKDDYSDPGVDVNPEYGQSTDYSDSVFVDKNTDYYGRGD